MAHSQDDKHGYTIRILEEITKLVDAAPKDHLKRDLKAYLDTALEYQRELERLYRRQSQR